MPLDAIKAAHIAALRTRAYANRTRTMVFVSQSAGVYSYTAVSVIFKFERQIDPLIHDMLGRAPNLEHDAVMIIPMTQSMAGVIYVADTTTATSGAVASAQKYEIIESLQTGILPAGTHYVVSLRRMR